MAQELIAWLDGKEPSQRDKLAILRAEHVATIRALPDDAHRDVIRAIKKRLGSPKLADEVAALVRELASGRDAQPVVAARAEPAPVAWIGTNPDDARLTALEAAIAAVPEEQGPYTVLADYLSSIGDPRGELIIIGHALAKNPAHKAMRTAWTKLLDENEALFWSDMIKPDLIVREVDWYMGFIRGFTLSIDRRIDLEYVLRVLLDDPGPARFVQSINVPAGNAGPIVAGALARRPRPTLHTLAIGSEYSALGDVSAMWPAVPRLRELRLDGAGTTLGDVHAPELERLGIDFGPPREDRHSIDFLAPIFAASGVPKLRALALTNCERADEIIAVLAQSSLLPQLVEIDLRYGTLSDAGAETILANSHAFAHVRRWKLDENYLTAPICERLTALGGEFELAYQRFDDGDRYVAVYE